MYKSSAISIAAGNGHIDALKCLLDHCTDESVIDGAREKQSPLHYACCNGKIDVVRYIVEKYPRVVNRNASAAAKHCTSLHIAAKSGNVECVQVLLEHGGESESADVNGATAFAYVTRYGKLVAVQFLHERGANAIASDRTGSLPLHVTCSNRDLDVARFLLQKHPDVINHTTTEVDGRVTPLHRAAQSGSVGCIELLLHHGANIETADNYGRTPLYTAACKGQLSALRYLLEKGACGTVTDNDDGLSMQDACVHGHVKVARCLLEHYPDTINATTAEGDNRRTAPYIAAQSGNVDCMEMLL